MINWLLRVFGASFVRKLAYLLAALLFVSVASLLGVGNARAQSGSDSHPGSREAGEHCNAVVANKVAAWCPTQNVAGSTSWVMSDAYCVPVTTAGAGSYQEMGHCTDSLPPAQSPRNYAASVLYTHVATTNDCGTAVAPNNWQVGEVNVCDKGCEFTPDPNQVISGYSATGQKCATGPGTNAPITDPDTDGDGISDSRDLYPNDPNESGDSDGDGTGDNGDFSPDDPTNGSDDGTGDNEDDNVSSGGGDCANPPISSGDGITSQIAYQTWHTRCAQISGNLIAQAQKDLLEAIKNQNAADPTPGKIDSVKAEIQTTNARIALLQAQNMLSIAETTAAINNQGAARATEQTASLAMLDQIRAKYGDEQAATRAKIQALMDQEADNQAALRTKLGDLGVTDNAKQDQIIANTAKIQELKDHAAEQLAALEALKAKADTGNGVLGTIKDGIDAIVGKLSGTIKTECTKNPDTGLCDGMPVGAGGGDNIDLTETNGWLEAINERGAEMMEFFTGINPIELQEGAGGPVDTSPMDGVTGADAFGEDQVIGEDGFDQSGFGWSRTCPAPVSFDVLGHAFSLDTGPMCNWLQLGGWFVMLLAAWRSIKAVVEA